MLTFLYPAQIEMVRKHWMAFAVLLISLPFFLFATNVNAQVVLAASPMTEARLIGTWISDAKRTGALRRYELEQEDETLEKFELTYGRLIKRFTATHIETYHLDRASEVYKSRYRVIAKSAQSAVIEIEAKPEQVIQHFFFEKDSIYLLVGYRVEFFKKYAKPID